MQARLRIEGVAVALAFATAWCGIRARPAFAAGQRSGAAQAVSSQNPDLVVSVSGVVLDPSGAAIPSATVTLRGDHGGERSTQSDAAGGFGFEGLSPGWYEIRVHPAGFKLYKTRLKAGSRNPKPLRISLELSPLHEEVTVNGGEERVNTEIGGNLDTVKLDRQTLNDLPILDQDIVGTISRLLNSASLGSGGASVVVDGMETSSIGVPASAIEEVRINRNPYSAEFARPGSGRIEIRTKAGSPKYHGSLGFGMRDYRLDARNAFAVERPQEQRRMFDGYFSGPLGESKKKTFLLSASREERDSQQIVYALSPSGDVRSNVPNPQRSALLSARLDDHLSKKEIFSVRYTFYDWTDKGEGVGGFNLPEVASDATSRKHEVYLAYKAVLSSNLVNELSVRGGRNDSASLSRRPGVPKIIVLDAFTTGGAQSDGRQTESFLQLTDVLSWSHGKHFVRTGVNIPDFSRRYLSDRTNFDGAFEFSSLADYQLGRPFSFTRQQGNGSLRLWNEELGAFVQDDVRLRPDFAMGFGLRYDWQSHLGDYNNLAPRLSFAYAPGKSRKTALRGGAGIFYDRTGVVPIEDALRYDGSRLQQIVVSDPGYPNPFSSAAVLGIQPSTIVRFAPNLRSPYSVQYSFGVETEMAKSTTLTATYLGTRGIKLFRSRDINAPLPPLYLDRPDPAIGILRQIESSGRLEGHSLRLSVQGNLTKFFNGMMQYSLGRTYDNTSGINSFPANQYDLSGEWSRSKSDTRHGVYAYGTLTAGKYFKLGMVFWAYSGTPYSITTGRDDNRDTIANDRPPGVRRNSMQGPAMKTLDLRWSRQFFLRPSRKEKGPSATLGLDAFNVPNWVSLSSVVGNLSSPFFGRPVAALAARRLQVSLRFDF